VQLVSLRAEYAVKAVLRLALTHSGEPVQAREIASYGGIPAKFVEQIMHDLRAAGLVKSVRGRSGGYVLARHPEEITFADIVNATDGASNGQRVASPAGADALVAPVWQRLSAAVTEVLESVTVAEVTAGAITSPMYYI
jgi:Rrf2 family protein